MSHSMSRIWIHSVWSTKDRSPFLIENKRKIIIPHIRDQFKAMDCEVKIINGIEDHLHSLFLLNYKYSIMEILKKVKGETSHWINDRNIFNSKFSWQVGYAAFSVSESLLRKVEVYIKNQSDHHNEMNFDEELKLLLKKHNLLMRNDK